MTAATPIGRLLLAVLAVLLACAASSQEDSDSLYRRARALAHEGRREEARALCREILERSPGHDDTRVLLGRLHGWDEEYDAARRELTRVLDGKPAHAEARAALIDVELWSGRPEAALRLADEGLVLDPARADLHYARARALGRLGRHAEAAEAAERVLALDPGRDDAGRLLRRVYDQLLGNRITARYEYEDFDDDLDSWQLLEVEYRRSYAFGSLLWRANLADRFDDRGAQLEMDAYPRIREGTYAWLNLGLSSSDLFPEIRLGGEVWQGLPRGWEASLGFRYLEFDPTDVTILTGTLARYSGNWWVQLRPGWVLEEGGDSLSGEVQVRRYLGGRYEYAGLTVGGGVDHETDIVTREEDRLDSFRVRAEIRMKVRDRLLLEGTLGYREQEFAENESRGSVFVGLGFGWFFQSAD